MLNPIKPDVHSFKVYEWYQKAIERGFKPGNYDNELRSVFMRCSQKIKNELKYDLL
jgi:hypothetical protein